MTRCVCGNEDAAYHCHSCAQPLGHNCRAAHESQGHVVTTAAPAPKKKPALAPVKKHDDGGKP